MTQVELAPPAVWDPGRRFLEKVVDCACAVSRLEMCIQRGTCGGPRPSAADMDHTPVAAGE